jgi:hypothetical protein
MENLNLIGYNSKTGNYFLTGKTAEDKEYTICKALNQYFIRVKNKVIFLTIEQQKRLEDFKLTV